MLYNYAAFFFEEQWIFSYFHKNHPLIIVWIHSSAISPISLCNLSPMSRTKMEKKLRTAKKVWKKLTNTIRSKLHALNIPKSIHTATRRLTSAVQRSLRLLIPSKFRRRLLSPKSSPSSYYRHNQNQNLYQYDQHLHDPNNFAAIHIDELFADRPAAIAETSKGKEVIEEESDKETTIYSIEDAWKIVVASSPHLRPVDERAEEFIRKFRREIILEKEKSLLEFEQMLARSSWFLMNSFVFIHVHNYIYMYMDLGFVFTGKQMRLTKMMWLEIFLNWGFVGKCFSTVWFECMVYRRCWRGC